MNRAHLLAIDLKLKGFYVVSIAIPWESAIQAIEDHRDNDLGMVLVAWPTQLPFPNHLRSLVDHNELAVCSTLAEGHDAYDLLLENC